MFRQFTCRTGAFYGNRFYNRSHLNVVRSPLLTGFVNARFLSTMPLNSLASTDMTVCQSQGSAETLPSLSSALEGAIPACMMAQAMRLHPLKAITLCSLGTDLSSRGVPQFHWCSSNMTLQRPSQKSIRAAAAQRPIRLKGTDEVGAVALLRPTGNDDLHGPTRIARDTIT